jgi:hypothetical protein
MTDDNTDKKLDSAPTSLRSVEAQAKASQKLLEIIVVQIIKVYRDKESPGEIKLLLTPLLFMVPVYSLVLVIFLGDVTYCMVRNRDLFLFHYLIFLGTTAPLTLMILLVYSFFSSKFENSRHLELQFETVTKAREPRKRRPARRRSDD